MTSALTVLRARVDNRLVHGQILEAWVPALGADAIVVADDDVAASLLMRSAMSIAVPRKVRLVFTRIADARATLEVNGPGAALVLFRDVADAVRARDAGLPLPALDIGNVHFAPGRRPVTPSIFLSDAELAELEKLSAAGVHVEVRTLPSDPARPVPARAP